MDQQQPPQLLARDALKDCAVFGRRDWPPMGAEPHSHNSSPAEEWAPPPPSSECCPVLVDLLPVPPVGTAVVGVGESSDPPPASGGVKEENTSALLPPPPSPPSSSPKKVNPRKKYLKTTTTTAKPGNKGDAPPATAKHPPQTQNAPPMPTYMSDHTLHKLVYGKMPLNGETMRVRTRSRHVVSKRGCSKTLTFHEEAQRDYELTSSRLFPQSLDRQYFSK